MNHSKLVEFFWILVDSICSPNFINKVLADNCIGMYYMIKNLFIGDKNALWW
ncbi:MAG: hypothetical protein VX523_01395 [Chloroflexota bacterium]|nr:hypothetical protein [Chloroflexota bacterium]